MRETHYQPPLRTDSSDFFVDLRQRQQKARVRLEYYVSRFQNKAGSDFYRDRKGSADRLYEDFKPDVKDWECARAEYKAAQMLFMAWNEGKDNTEAKQQMNGVIHVLSYGGDAHALREHCTAGQIAYCHTLANKAEDETRKIDGAIVDELAKAKAYTRPVSLTRRHVAMHIVPTVAGGLFAFSLYIGLKPRDEQNADGATRATLLGGGIGGVAEELAHQYITPRMSESEFAQLVSRMREFEGLVKQVAAFREEPSSQR